MFYFLPRLFLITILFNHCFPAFAQKKLTDRQIEDSIIIVKNEIKILKGEKGIQKDSLRLEFLNKLAVFYTKKSKDSALYFAQTALKEAREYQLKNVTAVSLYNISTIHEFYKEYITAEKNYLEWLEIRKSIDDDQYRWALNKLRRFYCITQQDEKLEKIEREWMNVLDRQLDQKHISPWFDWEEGTPEENYHYSMQPVLPYLVSYKKYFIAEKSLIHMLEKCPECPDNWETAEDIYSMSESKMLRDKDTASLTIWYEHWFNSLQKYGPGKEASLETFERIAQSYIMGYFKYDQYFDKFYPLMLGYTRKIGGKEAVHKLLQNSSKSYISSFSVKLNVYLYLIASSIEVKDNKTLDLTYAKADGLIKEYLARGYSKYDLLPILITAKSRSKDKKYVKWCDQKIDSLK